MKIPFLAIFICVFVETIICASIAEHPSSGSSTRLGYEQDGAASSKSSAIASLGSGRIPRQSRCIRCSYPYDDRYSSYGSRGYPDDYYGRQYGSMRNYYDGGATSRGGYDDRNWYYYTDRYDDRLSRYPDRYGSSALNVIDSNAPRKYDDRYASRTYDRYDIPYGYNDRSDYRTYYNDYRGNGYDNRDYYRGDTGYYRDRFYDRYRGGYGGYEGRYNDRDVYDRYYSKGSFDYRNYRPWDETYSTAYGPRPRPLGGAYLLDRDSNTPVAVNGGNKDSKMEDQPKVSAVEANDGGSTGNSGSSSSSVSSSSDDSNKN